MIRFDDSDAAYICKLIIVLKRLDMFNGDDDNKFWDDLEIRLSRWTKLHEHSR